MQADEVVFLDLLVGKVQYHVPKWQRRYCWDESDVTRLAEDLVAIARAANSDRAHYGGSLITFCPPGQPAGVLTTQRVVDGQQRLTTVSLMLACIADQMDDGDQYGDWTQDEIRDRLWNRKEEAPGKRRKLRLQLGDEEEYVRILRGEPKGNGAVTKAWHVVRELVGLHGADKLMAGLERFRVVSLAVGTNDDPQQIFESLNATGKALRESEKVKNWLLMDFPDARQQELYERYWLRMEEALDARRRPKLVDTFLRDLMRWRTGKITAVGETYEVLRRWAIEKGWEDRERRADLFREIAHLAELYGLLVGTAGPHPDDAIESPLRHLREMGMDTHRPFTLRLLSEMTPAEGDPIATVEQAGQMLEVVSTWITRLWLTDRTAGLNTAFARLSAGEPVDRDGYLDRWMTRIRRLGRQDVGVPTDEDLERGIHSRRMYFGKRARLAVLCALMEDEQGDAAPDRDALWAERVMPRQLNHAWREELGPDAEEMHAAWRYRLANLALVGAADDAPGEDLVFSAKKEWYRRSPVGLTKRLAAESVWDEDTLRRRSEELAQRAARVWPWRHGPTEAE